MQNYGPLLEFSECIVKIVMDKTFCAKTAKTKHKKTHNQYIVMQAAKHIEPTAPFTNL